MTALPPRSDAGSSGGPAAGRPETAGSALPPPPDPSGAPDARRAGGYGDAGYGYGAPPDVTSHDRRHPLELLKVLHKRRRLALTVFLVVFGTVTLYTFMATPLYQAQAQILIDDETPNVVQFQEVIEQDRQTTDYYQTQYRMLQSRALARRTIDALDLWDHPLFAPAPDERGLSLASVAEVLTGWLQRLSADDAVAEPSDDDASSAQSPVVDAFLHRLSISPVRNSRLVDVAFVSPNPRLSARVANALARQYIDQNLEYKFLATQEAADWLGQRLEEQRSAVDASERALHGYREETDAISLEDRQNIVVQRLGELNAAVTRARTERLQKEAAYRQLQAIRNDEDALDTFPTILSNGFIQQLKAQLADRQRARAELGETYGERHPRMIENQSMIDSLEQRLSVEIEKVVQAVRNEYEAARTHERTLNAALDEQKQEAMALNRVAIEYGGLRREAESNREIFQSLLQRTRETGITSDLQTNNVRIVDAAEAPRRPASPRRTLNLLAGLLGGLGLALGLTFFAESLDNRIKSPDEIKSHLGVPFLGMVPIVRAAGPEGPVLTRDEVPHDYAEAIRGIRTNVLFSVVEHGCKSIVVTSTGPKEGKTVLAGSLGLALAQAGQRVLMIDCDMRRPRIHELLEVPHEPGLSNVMVGEVPPEGAIRQLAGQASAWVLPAGTLPPNPAELLGSSRFARFLDDLERRFDWIILDSPPVLAVTDAAVLAHRATGVLFVVGAEMTSRGAAKAALDQIDAAKGRHLGAVLNKVNLRRNSYYYSQYYRREYESYYRPTG